MSQHITPGEHLPTYVNTIEAAEYLRLSRQQLEGWQSRGGGPVYVKLDRAVRYRRSDLDSFMAERLVSSTSEADERGRD